MGALLGKPLAWLASLGTGVLTALIVWALTRWWDRPDGAALIVVVILAAKFSGWLVSEYGNKPTSRNKPRRPADRSERKHRNAAMKYEEHRDTDNSPSVQDPLR